MVYLLQLGPMMCRGGLSLRILHIALRLKDARAVGGMVILNSKTGTVYD
jgi:hypothetical protein